MEGVTAMAAKNSGKKATTQAAKRKTVTFRLHAPHAAKVDVAGSFSNWTLRQMKKRKDGTWTTSLRPEPGLHQYKFLVDHEWIEDPNNPDKVENEYGSCNSICRVG
jgi:1,4-alpha-glucan branching enzyme